MINSIILLIIGLIIAGFLIYMTKMPDHSYQGPFLPLSENEQKLVPLLQQHIQALTRHGPRHIDAPGALKASNQYIKQVLKQAGMIPKTHIYEIDKSHYENIFVEIKGSKKPEEIIIIGAHYDSAMPDSVGANDNGSGVAALLYLATQFLHHKPEKTYRFVFFVNEEPPFFKNKEMGSFQYVQKLKKEKENILAMICLETIGYYSQEKNSQQYPFPFSFFYPNQGNFIAFVSNLASRDLLMRTLKIFRETTQFPSEGGAIPTFIPGVDWSDQWAFWQAGIPAVMITDTALFRYPYYHTAEDTFEKINYEGLARVTVGIEKMLQQLRFD